MSKLLYPTLIRPLTSEEGGGYLVEFPDLPGCIADGETPEAALAEAEDALKSWLKTAKKHGDEIPDPSTSIKYSGQWRIRIPKSLHATLVLYAKREGVSLNTFAATLLAKSLGQLMPHKRKHQSRRD
ncbi:MAG: type II toxin-antitoxin system HicB family antitoxin [Proteobacteria bacterium]|nr:type II toxin-antitoxin system HicB family antitoxin [Pseudomonadota bacterium]